MVSDQECDRLLVEVGKPPDKLVPRIKWYRELVRKAAALGRTLDQTTEEKDLRRLLAMVYAGPMLYTDDGEMRDCRDEPKIDFKRDHPKLLEDKLRQRGRLAKLRKAIHDDE